MKKLAIFLMALIIVYSAVPFSNASATVFSDVKKYEEEIGYLTDRNILTGYPDGTFKPEKELTRLQGVRVLLKAKGITDLTAPDPVLTDMAPTSYGYKEVAKAMQLGIISGKTNADGSKYFDPSGKLTRGQMAKIIVESMNYKIDASHAFRDVPKSSGYYNYISTLAAERITTGYENRSFKPNNTVTRAHFAVFVARMLNDKYKQAPMTASYRMDKSFVYSWEIVEDGKRTTSTSTYIGQYNGGSYPWDLWEESGAFGTARFLIEEDRNGLYMGFPASHSYKDLAYPLYAGKIFGDPTNMIDDTMHTVISVNRIVRTKAGEFSNVVEVKNSLGSTTFYAPNIGQIKRVWPGNNYVELTMLTPRK